LGCAGVAAAACRVRLWLNWGDATNSPVTQAVFILHVNRAELEEGKPCCVPASSSQGRASLQQSVFFFFTNIRGFSHAGVV